ncbi:DUF2309 domain-containing protein [Pseudoalteromonas sp. KS88]|uniref:YbcC family protein n=1 Tax=Pseudoalteromonas sp. KS88 TaxID=2109918 RepID=UPI0010821607|nr:DUF2309 domain-containing protein [Pseudoalteromonas sp. KS88]TGE84680.1 DUF2309 domain-containing protein [Pseudoalteromonas sp. KS88]
MNAAIAQCEKNTLSPKHKDILNTVCGYIAPSWPLDQMIAVNPFWQMRTMPIEHVAARIGTLSNAKLQMPKAYYQAKYKQHTITDKHLQDAAFVLGVDMTIEQLKDSLNIELPVKHWHNISDLLDTQRDPHKMAWHDEIIQQISQFCAAHYQQLGPMLHRNNVSQVDDLYAHWLKVIKADKGVSIIMDEKHLNHYFAKLPDTADELIAMAIDCLGISEDILEYYAHSLLLDINGWASWLAYLRWQGDLYQQPHEEMHQLLAIRMAWDVVIWQYVEQHDSKSFQLLRSQWQHEKAELFERFNNHKIAQQPGWVWAKAHELSYQQTLNETLLNASKATPAKVQLQAVFCIDVRSEVMRRALESQSQTIETFGFAGFFGLPIEYQANASALKRPQLPGLLKPIIQVSEQKGSHKITAERSLTAAWQNWSKAAPSAFSMVESMGWLYALKLLKNTFLANNTSNHHCHDTQWQLSKDNIQLNTEDKTELAYTVLNAMGLTEYAEKILLVGHGSHSTNNLHAAGLDCGACGGQTGEVNVRVLASLLNEPDVRKQLQNRGISLPDDCQFVAALHNTTTDEITLFDSSLNPTMSQWLRTATKQAQQERLQHIDPRLANASHNQINHAYQKRANDWSQVRPEWGLANNAAFIVAPRNWTRDVDLKGRSFLHDYQWQHDTEFALLELIMTAPMIVTNWINTQYNASVTDNYKYGSGNKVLHNAVGGNIGVFEGNGGDLRIGLAMQSLHNGNQWMHEPLRLSVYIAAPRDAIFAIYQKHSMIKNLVDNDWLTLLRWGDSNEIERLYKNAWHSQIAKAE